LKSLRLGFALDESRFRGLIHLHSYHDPKKQLAFWSDVTGIPKSQFQKPYLKPNTGVRKRKNYQGCLSLRYGEAKIARKLDAIYHMLALKLI